MEQNKTCPHGCTGPEQGGSGCMAVTGDCAMDEPAAPAVDAAKLDDLGKLKALAEGVPEHIQLNGWYVEVPRFGHQHVYADNFKGHGRQHIATLPADKSYFGTMADFIAAANPAAILRIAALVAQQAARIADLVSALAAAREMVGHPDNVAFIDRTLAGATKEGK